MIAFLYIFFIINIVSGEAVVLYNRGEYCGVRFIAKDNDVYNIKYHYNSLDIGATISGSVYDSMTNKTIRGTEFFRQLDVKNEINITVNKGIYNMCFHGYAQGPIDPIIIIIEMSAEKIIFETSIKHEHNNPILIIVLMIMIIVFSIIFVYLYFKIPKYTNIKTDNVSDLP